MEPSTTVAVGEVTPAQTAATAARIAVEELPMPTAGGRASLRTRMLCIALLFAAAVMAFVFIAVPLATALHVVLYQPLLDLIFAAAIIAELALVVVFIILKTEKSVLRAP